MEVSDHVDGRFQIGEFEFDPVSGEVRPAAGEGEIVRLPPQPARLLTLLVHKNGELLTREEIQTELWPEVHVDLDQSLSFCLHQVRSALGDSGTSPRYVETLPRRGYRLLQPVQAIESEEEAPVESPRLRRGLAALAVLALLGAVSAVYWKVWDSGKATASAPPRLAVMPFRPPQGVLVEGEPWLIAERLLLSLGNLGPETLGVIGPATTMAYSSDFSDLRRLLNDVKLDYILNGRFIESPDTGTGLLVELIRASDGVHLWVEEFDDLAAHDEIAERVHRAAVQEIAVRPDG